MTRESEQALAQAWYTAAFERTKRLPRLETLLAKTESKGLKQTPQEMKERIRSLVGEFKPKKRG